MEQTAGVLVYFSGIQTLPTNLNILPQCHVTGLANLLASFHFPPLLCVRPIQCFGWCVLLRLPLPAIAKLGSKMCFALDVDNKNC